MNNVYDTRRNPPDDIYIPTLEEWIEGGLGVATFEPTTPSVGKVLKFQTKAPLMLDHPDHLLGLAGLYRQAHDFDSMLNVMYLWMCNRHPDKVPEGFPSTVNLGADVFNDFRTRAVHAYK